MIKAMKRLFLVGVLSLFSVPGFTASSGMPLAEIDVATDNESRQRGFEVYYNVCRLCHELTYVKYQYLAGIGFDKSKVDDLRGEKLANTFIKSTVEDDMATKLYGAVPPDLSLMAKARKQGPRYIYTLMTAYYEKEDNVYDNKLFHGIKMPDPFGYSVATDDAKVKIESDVKDLVAFLEWSADPKADDRKSMGVWVIGYLFILSVLMYLVMKRVWSRLPPPVSESLKR